MKSSAPKEQIKRKLSEIEFLSTLTLVVMMNYFKSRTANKTFWSMMPHEKHSIRSLDENFGGDKRSFGRELKHLVFEYLDWIL